MPLDKFDELVLNSSGKAQDILYKIYGKKIGQNNAEKQLAGIRTHVNFKLENAEDERKIGEMEETVVKADGSRTTKRMLMLSEEESKDPQYIMYLMGFDPLQWSLVSCRVRRNYWDVTMKLAKGSDDKGRKIEFPHKETNHAFECIVTVKPIQNILSTEYVKELFEKFKPPDIVPVAYKQRDNVLVEPSILDFHLGKDLSLQLEIDLFKITIVAMLERLKTYNIKPERLLFQIGQDFIHVDNSNKTTTAGTIIDSNHAKWSEIYTAAQNLAIWAVEQFRQLCPVDLVYVPGNHDKTLSFCIASMLDKVYENCDDVTVDLVDFPRKYYQYGLCAIGMSHGREEGKRIQHTMPQEAPEIYTNTVYREFHLGDLHHEKAEEVGGVIYRRTSAITGLDEWHIGKAYRAIRKAPMYIWHKDGELDIINVRVKL